MKYQRKDKLMEQKVYDFLNQYNNENKLRIILTSKKLDDSQKYDLINTYKLITENKNRYSEKLENIIKTKTDPHYAYVYARDVIKGRWKEAEEYIKTDPYWAFRYARDVIKGRWKEAEEYIKTNPQSAYFYARDVIKGRWPEAEDYIKKDPYYAYHYAKNVIKGRWPEAEEYIKKDPKYAAHYAKEVIGYENFWENTFVYDDPLNFIKESVKAKLEQEELERQAKLEQEERERKAEIERQDRITNKHNQLNEFVEKIGHLVVQDGSTVNDYANKIRPNSNEDFVLSKVCKQITEYAIQNYAKEQ